MFRRVWDPLRTSDSRLLRQIVNESRTGGSWSGPNTAALGPQLGPAVAALSVPVREAWLLRDLCAKPHADAMRAIEIEQNETLRPSELDALAARGEEHLRAALGDRYEALVLAGRDALAHADARAGMARVEERMKVMRKRRRIVGAVQLAVFLACCGFLLYVLLDLKHAAVLERESKRPSDRYSLPYEGPEKK